MFKRHFTLLLLLLVGFWYYTAKDHPMLKGKLPEISLKKKAK